MQWWQQGPWALLLALGIALAVLLGDPVAPGAALSLPWRQPAHTSHNSAGLKAAGHLQEVAPPVGVQQLQQALADRQPSLEILTPTNNSLVPAGPWTLRVNLNDWPLVDGGELGLGPHLVVQLDSEPPRRQTSTDIAMPPLSPGSHRLTVYAARPWGEAVKSPGSYRQIRIHRAAANPLALPTPGSPQLIPVSPEGSVGGEPVLLDWLLLDAPLQHLRGDDATWRLRVSINGDSFLVDRQLPLWLKGLSSGSNAILLELVDGRGEPLNPPFNSVVSEINLAPGQQRPRWLGARLEDGELAVLLGAQAPVAEGSDPTEATPSERSRNLQQWEESIESLPGAGGDDALPMDGNGAEPDRLEALDGPEAAPDQHDAAPGPDGNNEAPLAPAEPEAPGNPDTADRPSELTGLNAEPSADQPLPQAALPSPTATPLQVSR